MKVQKYHKLNRHFEKIGTQLMTVDLPAHRKAYPGDKYRFQLRPGVPFTVDIKPGLRKGKPEYIEVRHEAPISMVIQDVQPEQKHLLVQIVGGGQSRKFLIGHDERHYFAAGVEPNTRDVLDAMHKLQPPEVREKAQKLPKKERFSRHNEVFKRQGEWFFVPTPELDMLKVAPKAFLIDEPLRRGRSKPHVCETMYRTGGVDVLFHQQHAPNGISMEEFQKLDVDKTRVGGWRKMRRDAHVYVKGKVSHPDHTTLILKGWHRVYMSGEVMMEEMAFLD